MIHEEKHTTPTTTHESKDHPTSSTAHESKDQTAKDQTLADATAHESKDQTAKDQTLADQTGHTLDQPQTQLESQGTPEPAPFVKPGITPTMKSNDILNIAPNPANPPKQ